MNQTGPSVIETGDNLYFAPTGKDYTVPEAGTVSASSKPGATDSIWTTYALGSVKKPANDKMDAKDVVITRPMPGTGVIVPYKIKRPMRTLTSELEMNELSRLALAGFYKSDLIEIDDTSFYPMSGAGSIEGWLKRQRYDGVNGLWITDDWYVDLNCTDLGVTDPNLLNPKFTVTWLYASPAGSAI